MQLIELLECEHQDCMGRLLSDGAARTEPMEESTPVGKDSYRNMTTTATPVIAFEPPARVVELTTCPRGPDTPVHAPLEARHRRHRTHGLLRNARLVAPA